MKQTEIFVQVWPRWLDKKLAAIYTSYSEKMIENFMKSGDLPYTRVNGGYIRIDVNDLDRLMEKDKIDIRSTKRKILRSLI